MEEDPTLLTLDEELLGLILENMTHDQILDWCNSHSQFSALCKDPSSIVGPILLRKMEEEVVAMLQVRDNNVPEEINFLAVFISSLLYVRKRIILSRDDADTLLQGISENQDTFIRSEENVCGESESIHNNPTNNEVEIAVDGTYIYVQPEIFLDTLNAAIKAADRGVTGQIYVYRDGNTRLL